VPWDVAVDVEAGTGMMVPALLSGRSVIISTGTRTLQTSCSVPLLARALEDSPAEGPQLPMFIAWS
jgi:hypothetical protein